MNIRRWGLTCVLGMVTAWPCHAQSHVFTIANDTDDGTEVNRRYWHEDGYNGEGRNRMGINGGERFDTGLRFEVPELTQGDRFVYARLVLRGTGHGQVDFGAGINIVGVNQDRVEEFSAARPSELPKTFTRAEWLVAADWPLPEKDYWCDPIYRNSPDISPIINEILRRPGWGTGAPIKTIGLVLENDGTGGTNYLTFHDYHSSPELCGGAGLATVLELYATLYSTFVGPELLGCPTDRSVTVNALSLLTLEAYFEYGTSPGHYTWQTPVLTCPGETPIEVVLGQSSPLMANTRYYYRMRFRRPGDPVFADAPERHFHTRRSAGATFVFTIQSDTHLQDAIRSGEQDSLDLYRRTLENARADNPDFHIAMGDTFHSEFYQGRDIVDFDEAIKRHLDQRPYLGLLCHSTPFFLALGNHEGEQGWRLDGTPDNVAIWATMARKRHYPNPCPDGFYSGSMTEETFVGLRENYYAWEWGDALFVVLDPFWYTTTKPHDLGDDLNHPRGDRWDWTLGFEQYDWLRQVLENSDARFKFVLSHHVTGGVNAYGRGGIEAASHPLGGCGSYEWGGEDVDGTYVFDSRRPGWGQPVHQLMALHDVAIYFHGHDHVFVKQELDGIVYQECGQPADAQYAEGFFGSGGYLNGDKVNNSGHLRVTVSPATVTVDYLRAYLPGDGMNGSLAYTYSVSDCNNNSTPDVKDIAAGHSGDQDGDGVPDECQVTIGMDPHDPPVVVPGGGVFSYTGYLESHLDHWQTVDIWITIEGPDGTIHGPVRQWIEYPLGPQQQLELSLEQTVPSWAPAGTYQCVGYHGDGHTMTPFSSVFFEFTVIPGTPYNGSQTRARPGQSDRWPAPIDELDD